MQRFRFTTPVAARAGALVALAGALLGALAGCELPPRFVEESSEVDGFLLRSAYQSACIGLDAQKADVREHTARRLAEYEHVRVANDCLCASLYDAETGAVNDAVLRGLASSRRDDLAQCVMPALEDDRIKEEARVAAVRGLGAMEAKAAYEKLAELAKSDEDPGIRAVAAEALRPSSKAVEVLIRALTTDEDASVRSAAAKGLTGRRNDAAERALRDSLGGDADGGTRAAAALALGERPSADNDAALCAALTKDEDAGVRYAVVTAWEGTKRKRALDCLDRRMKKPEEAGSVREAVLATLVSSSSPRAAEMLCDHIAGWVRLYLRDKIYLDVPGSDIVKAQNDRDYERSYECVERALRKGGFSCYGKNYLGHWMREFGGSASTPWCPGMERN